MLFLLLVAFVLLVDGWEDFGRQADGERLARMELSPNWRDGVFVNGIPLYNPFLERPSRWLDSSDYASPKTAPELAQTEAEIYEQAAP